MRIGLARDARRILLGRDEAMTPSPDPAIIERAAKAIWNREITLGLHWKGATEKQHEHCRKLARAAALDAAEKGEAD